MLRASGDRAQSLAIAAAVKGPANTWLQGVAREQQDWVRVLAEQEAKAANPRAELHRLAVRGMAYRLANKPAQADEEFKQMITQAPNDDVWFGAKALLLNDRPVEALELLKPGLKPMKIDSPAPAAIHRGAGGIRPDLRIASVPLTNDSGVAQQRLRVGYKRGSERLPQQQRTEAAAIDEEIATHIATILELEPTDVAALMKLMMAPKARKSVVTALRPADPTSVGTANSPPAMNVAGVPLIVTSVGSLKRRMMPCDCR